MLPSLNILHNEISHCSQLANYYNISHLCAIKLQLPISGDYTGILTSVNSTLIAKQLRPLFTNSMLPLPLKVKIIFTILNPTKIVCVVQSTFCFNVIYGRRQFKLHVCQGGADF